MKFHEMAHGKDRGLQGPRPAPLQLRRESQTIKKSVFRKPPIIIYAKSPPVIHAKVGDFMSLVQSLTGQETAPPLDQNEREENCQVEDQNAQVGALDQESSQTGEFVEIVSEDEEVIHVRGDSETKSEEKEKETVYFEPAVNSPLFTPMPKEEGQNHNMMMSMKDFKDLPFFTPPARPYQQGFMFSSLSSPSPTAFDLFNSNTSTGL